jgi:hypothetical protein
MTLQAFSALQLLWAAAVVFGAYVVRGMSGFGAGLVATPLLAFAFPMTTVVPTTALLVFVLFIFLTLRDWRMVLWDEFRRLLPPTMLGVAGGLYLFSVLDNRLLTKMLGAFLLAYASYMLIGQWLGAQQLKLSTRWAWPLGFADRRPVRRGRRNLAGDLHARASGHARSVSIHPGDTVVRGNDRAYRRLYCLGFLQHRLADAGAVVAAVYAAGNLGR